MESSIMWKGKKVKNRNMLWAFFLMVTGVLTMASFGQTAQDYELLSPDKEIKVVISTAETITYSVYYQSRALLEKCPISMTVNGHGVLGRNPKMEKAGRGSTSEELHTVVKVKSASITDNFNSLAFEFAGGYGLDFRG